MILITTTISLSLSSGLFVNEILKMVMMRKRRKRKRKRMMLSAGR
jgi:hypothetical protein